MPVFELRARLREAAKKVEAGDGEALERLTACGNKRYLHGEETRVIGGAWLSTGAQIGICLYRK
jgi:hypothetical protein